MSNTTDKGMVKFRDLKDGDVFYIPEHENVSFVKIIQIAGTNYNALLLNSFCVMAIAEDKEVIKYNKAILKLEK